MLRPAALPRRRRFGWRALRRSQSGIAMTEFAMALPAILTLGLVGLEVAWLMMAHLKVSNIAMIAADNASRVRESIDEGNVAELFLGARLAGDSIDFSDRGRIILYSIEPTTAGNMQWIRWQRCTGSKVVAPSYGRPRTAAGAAITNGTEIYNVDRTTASTNPSSGTHASAQAAAVGPVGNQIAAQSGTAVMLAEAVYDYQPLIVGNLLGNIEIRYESAFNVRQRNNQSITNSARSTPAFCG